MAKRLIFILIIAVMLVPNLHQSSTAQEIDQTLTVELIVINDHGGRATPDTFNIDLHLQDPSQGRHAPVQLRRIEGTGELLPEWTPDSASLTETVDENIGYGAYSVSVSGPGDIALRYTGRRSDGCKGIMGAEPITCKITLDDNPVKLTIRKVIDGETSYEPSDFTMNLYRAKLGDLSGYKVFEEYPGSTDGVVVEMPAVPYVVFETADNIFNFGVSSTSGCLGRGSQPPEIGDEITCIITNEKLDDLYFKVIGIQNECGAGEIDWSPALMTFTVPETPGTDMTDSLTADANGYHIGSDSWAFNYGDINLPRVGDLRGRFGVKITGLDNGERVIAFPHNAYHEWRVTPLSTDMLLGRYDGFLEGECIGRIYFTILRNKPASQTIQLQMAQLEAQKKAQLGDDAPAGDIPLDLEDMVFVMQAAQRNLYSNATLQITDDEALQGLFTIDPTSEEWASRIGWIEGKTSTNQTEDNLPNAEAEVPSDA